MRRKPDGVPAPDTRLTTVIGKETTITGKLTCRGSLRVDGRVAGEIEAQGDVLVAENGAIGDAVKATNLIVAGEVRGQVDVEGRLELRGTGKLYGNVRAGALVVEAGAVFRGESAMQNGGPHASAAAAQPAVARAEAAREPAPASPSSATPGAPSQSGPAAGKTEPKPDAAAAARLALAKRQSDLGA